MKYKLTYGLGCLGFKSPGLYQDFTFTVDRPGKTIQRFVNRNDGESKSWYQLRRRGLKLYWYLLRREDKWGEFRNKTTDAEAHRRPPLREEPESVPQRAWDLRKEFRPYLVIDWYGEQMEVMSFPCPELHRVTLMIRVPNDPTTLQEVVLEEYVPAKVRA